MQSEHMLTGGVKEGHEKVSFVESKSLPGVSEHRKRPLDSGPVFPGPTHHLTCRLSFHLAATQTNT